VGDQKKPTLSDLYLIHSTRLGSAAEHISHLIASLGNPCVPPAKAGRNAKNGANARSGGIPFRRQSRVEIVDKLTSGAFVGMWRERVAHFIEIHGHRRRRRTGEPVNFR